MISRQANPVRTGFDNLENLFCATQRSDAILSLILESKADALLSSCEDVFHALYSVANEIKEMNQMVDRMLRDDEEVIRNADLTKLGEVS